VRRYYITDQCTRRDLECAVREGVEMMQVREKHLPAGALFALVREAVAITAGSATRVLVNDRLDVALAAGAHGVHLRGSSWPVERVRAVVPAGFLIGVSCHAGDGIPAAADFAVLSPVFAKPGYAPPLGLERFGELARAAPVPVFALGGVTWENAPACLAAGAAGIAGIRLFQDRWRGVDLL